MAHQPLEGRRLPIIEVSRSHSDTDIHTLGKTPLYERSPRHRDLYLTTHNTNKRQTSMPQAGFEQAVPVSERTETHAIDCAATGTGISKNRPTKIVKETFRTTNSAASVTYVFFETILIGKFMLDRIPGLQLSGLRYRRLVVNCNQH